MWSEDEAKSKMGDFENSPKYAFFMMDIVYKNEQRPQIRDDKRFTYGQMTKISQTKVCGTRSFIDVLS